MLENPGGQRKFQMRCYLRRRKTREVELQQLWASTSGNASYEKLKFHNTLFLCIFNNVSLENTTFSLQDINNEILCNYFALILCQGTYFIIYIISSFEMWRIYKTYNYRQLHIILLNMSANLSADFLNASNNYTFIQMSINGPPKGTIDF